VNKDRVRRPRMAPVEPGSWSPSRMAEARAKLRRSFKRMLEL
jgi:hypothetical protein